jgi:hypothetical protein
MRPRTTDPTSERMRLFSSSKYVCNRERSMWALAARTSCSISREKGRCGCIAAIPYLANGSSDGFSLINFGQ